MLLVPQIAAAKWRVLCVSVCLSIPLLCLYACSGSVSLARSFEPLGTAVPFWRKLSLDLSGFCPQDGVAVRPHPLRRGTTAVLFYFVCPNSENNIKLPLFSTPSLLSCTGTYIHVEGKLYGKF